MELRAQLRLANAPLLRDERLVRHGPRVHSAARPTWISRFLQGSRPDSLLKTLRNWKPDSYRESRTSFDRVLQLLGEGKPIVALLGWGRSYTFALGAVPSTLHWVVLTGYDMKSSTIYYTDTKKGACQFSFDEFNQKWNWYSSGAKGGVLTGTLDVPERTILY